MSKNKFRKAFQFAVRSAFFVGLLSSPAFSFGKDAQQLPLDKSMKDYRMQSAAKQNADDKWPMLLQLEGKKGNFRNLTRLSWMAPIWQDNDNMFFADIRFMMDNQKNREGNFGVGYRHIMRDWDTLSDGVILGAYAFYDRKRSTFKNYFNQLVVGAEALGEYFQVRGNYYRPSNKTYQLSRDVTISDARSGWDIVDDRVAVTYGTTVNIQTDTERSLVGYDFEARGKFPVADDINVWVGAGYYRFHRDSIKQRGPTAMADLELIDGLGIPGSRASLGFEYRNVRDGKSNKYGVLKLTTPLMALAGDRKDLKLSGIDYEMTRFIERDVDIPSGSASSTESTDATGQAIIEDLGGATITATSDTEANKAQWIKAVKLAIELNEAGLPIYYLVGASGDSTSLEFPDSIANDVATAIAQMDDSDSKTAALAALNAADPVLPFKGDCTFVNAANPAGAEAFLSSVTNAVIERTGAATLGDGIALLMQSTGLSSSDASIVVADIAQTEDFLAKNANSDIQAAGEVFFGLPVKVDAGIYDAGAGVIFSTGLIDKPGLESDDFIVIASSVTVNHRGPVPYGLSVPETFVNQLSQDDTAVTVRGPARENSVVFANSDGGGLDLSGGFTLPVLNNQTGTSLISAEVAYNPLNPPASLPAFGNATVGIDLGETSLADGETTLSDLIADLTALFENSPDATVGALSIAGVKVPIEQTVHADTSLLGSSLNVGSLLGSIQDSAVSNFKRPLNQSADRSLAGFENYSAAAAAQRLKKLLLVAPDALTSFDNLSSEDHSNALVALLDAQPSISLNDMIADSTTSGLLPYYTIFARSLDTSGGDSSYEPLFEGQIFTASDADNVKNLYAAPEVTGLNAAEQSLVHMAGSALSLSNAEKARALPFILERRNLDGTTGIDSLFSTVAAGLENESTGSEQSDTWSNLFATNIDSLTEAWVNPDGANSVQESISDLDDAFMEAFEEQVAKVGESAFMNSPLDAEYRTLAGAIAQIAVDTTLKNAALKVATSQVGASAARDVIANDVGNTIRLGASTKMVEAFDSLGSSAAKLNALKFMSGANIEDKTGPVFKEVRQSFLQSLDVAPYGSGATVTAPAAACQEFVGLTTDYLDYISTP